MKNLRARIVASANARIDSMTAEELLEFIDRGPLSPSTRQEVSGPVMTAIRRAVARLDALTTPQAGS
jgi:hypothetical protein